MGRRRADILAGLQAAVDKYGAEPGEVPKVTVPIVKPVPAPVAPVEPIVPTTPVVEPKGIYKGRPTYITPNLRGPDRKWLQHFITDPKAE